MTSDLDVLRIISERFQGAGIQFMLTGSFALAYYGTPRMTRDLDFVVELLEQQIGTLTSVFAEDFYIDEDDARAAIKSQRMFNLMHLTSGIKVDLIIRKDTDYRRAEFARRQQASLTGVATWVVSREDLILSKLVWARDADSERQKHDAAGLLGDTVDWTYLRKWAPELGVAELLEEISKK